ncbi:synaptonemal complex protein 2-like [Fundulus diaphanus]
MGNNLFQFQLQMDDCLLHGDPSQLVSLLHQEGLSSSTLTGLHHLVTKELRSSGFCRVLVVLKALSTLLENKDDQQTLLSLGLTAKVVLWFSAVHDLLTSDLQQGSAPLLSLTEEFFNYFLVSSMLGSEVWCCSCKRSLSGELSVAAANQAPEGPAGADSLESGLESRARGDCGVSGWAGVSEGSALVLEILVHSWFRVSCSFWLFEPTHFCFLLGSDLLLHVAAASVQELQQLVEHLLDVLHCVVSRAVDVIQHLLKQLQVRLSVLDPLLDVLLGGAELLLPVGPLCRGGDGVVASMVLQGAQVADGLLVAAAEDLLHLVVKGADVLLDVCRGRDQLMALKGGGVIVRLEVEVTVGGQALQAGLGGLQLPPRAEITAYVSWSHVEVKRRSVLDFHLLHFFHQRYKMHLRFCVLVSCLTSAASSVDQLSGVLLQLARTALEAGVHFPLRLEAVRTFNSILEFLSRQQRRRIQNDQNQIWILSQVASAVLTVGDYEMQVSLVEVLCRLTPRREREQRANQWFSNRNVGAAFCDIRDADFEVDSRRFLNFLNCYHSGQRRVYSFPCLQAFLSSTQLFRPKDEKLNEFWIDFNVGSACVSFFIDDPQSFLWESVHLLKEDVDYYSLQVKNNETVLSIRLTNPIMHLNIRGHLVELTFTAEHHRELQEAAWNVFNRAATSAGEDGPGQNPPSEKRCPGRSYSRKRTASKSQLKILPLSSPSSEDESSPQAAASNRAEVLFDRIRHSTPTCSSAVLPPFDPTAGPEAQPAHLERPPSGDGQGAELQTEDADQGRSSPSKKVRLVFHMNPEKFECLNRFLFSCRKRKAEPLQSWEESYSPIKGSGKVAEEAPPSEGVWPDLTGQKAEPESLLACDITAAFASFKAQLEQRFTDCWQKAEAEVQGSLRDCQLRVSSLLTAVHQHRLLLLQQFQNSVTDQLKQLEENCDKLNSINSQIQTLFHSKMEHMSSFCEEHLKRLETVEPDQLKTACSSSQ